MLHQLEFLLSHYGYLGITIALIGGIIGLPIPDEILLTYVGYNVYTGNMVYTIALICATLGAFTGISISYFLGTWLGTPFILKYGPKFHIDERRYKLTHDLFEKYGPYLLFFGFFIPGVRHISAYIAGITRLDLRKFVLFAFSGGFVWVFFFITVGRELGKKWIDMKEYGHHFGFFVIVFIAVCIILGYFIMKKRRFKEIK